MKIFQKPTVLMSILLLLSAIPALAQIDNRVTFDAPFAFYAGNAKMPAGHYTVTQPDAIANVLLIESADRSHSAFVDYIQGGSGTPSPKTEVTFNKYGTTEFLNSISLQGQESEMQLVTSTAEQNAAKAASAAKHKLSASRGR
jgi:hypothetical protein